MIFLDADVVIDALDVRRVQIRRRLGETQTSGERLGLSSVALF
jgi:hypothetical protein